MPPFYAELLPNIGSISLTVSLPSPISVHTRLFVPHCSSSATLDHDGESTSVTLPVQANPHTSILVLEAGIAQKALSCRLPVALPLLPGVTRGPGSANWAPWSAPELLAKPAASFSCRTCSAVVIPTGRIHQWKDLPSGNWADMMDFWHCHKPHGEDGSSDNKYSGLERGFVIEAGTGLVDRGYFLFSREDCEAVQIFSSSLRCSGCNCLLGVAEKQTESGSSTAWRLHKWDLRLDFDGSETAYPLECFLSSQFITYAEEEGFRHLLVSASNQKSGERGDLKLWIFNTDIRYTHSNALTPARGVKVFWQTVGRNEKVSTDSLKATGFESVELDAKSFAVLKQCLLDSSLALPEDMRKISVWNVGSLRRFEHPQ